MLTCLNEYLFKGWNVSIAEFRDSVDAPDINYQIKILRQTHNFYNNTSQVVQCYEQCPIECNLVEYSLASTNGAYPTESYARLMKEFFGIYKLIDPNKYNFSNISDFEKKILSVNIFYRVTFNRVFIIK